MSEKHEDFKTTYTRLRAKRDAIRAGKKNPRPERTPFAMTWKAKPKRKA